MGQQVAAGQQIGTTSTANHTHWEVRDSIVPDFAGGEDNFSNNSDPITWLTLAPIGGTGTVLLAAGSAVLLWLLWRHT